MLSVVIFLIKILEGILCGYGRIPPNAPYKFPYIHHLNRIVHFSSDQICSVCKMK